MADLLTQSSAVISPCGQYRYRLERFWSGEHALPFIMLNPSTADASLDDPTIRRCMGFARNRGYGGIIVANLFAYRATSPADMKRADAPVGGLNDSHLAALMQWALRADVPVIAAWGANGSFQGRDQTVIALADLVGCDLMCLGTTAAGHPRHPLYVPAAQPFVPFLSPTEPAVNTPAGAGNSPVGREG